MKVSRSLIVGLAAATSLLGVSGGLVYLSLRGATNPTVQRGVPVERGLREFVAIFNPDQPLMIPGIRTSIGEATARVHYPLYRPIGETPSQVWVSEGLGEAGLRYGSTLVIAYSRWQPGTNVPERYQRQAASWNVGYTTTIGGNPAWVVPQDAQSPGSPSVNVVHVTIGDVEVTLFGRIPLPDLLDKAENLQA